jgi:dynein heavy chain 1
VFRLIEDEERQWTDQNVDMVAAKHFPNIDREAALARPILFSKWLSKDYVPVEREVLREYTKARLKASSKILHRSYAVLVLS